MHYCILLHYWEKHWPSFFFSATLLFLDLTCPDYCKQPHFTNFSPSFSSSNPKSSKTAPNRLPGSAIVVDQCVSRVTGNLAAGVECRQPSEAGKAWLATWDFLVGLERDKRALRRIPTIHCHTVPHAHVRTRAPTLDDLPFIFLSSINTPSPRQSHTPTARAGSATSTLSIRHPASTRIACNAGKPHQTALASNPQSDSRGLEICSLLRASPKSPPTQPRRRTGRLGRVGPWSSC